MERTDDNGTKWRLAEMRYTQSELAKTATKNLRPLLAALRNPNLTEDQRAALEVQAAALMDIFKRGTHLVWVMVSDKENDK